MQICRFLIIRCLSLMLLAISVFGLTACPQEGGGGGFVPSGTPRPPQTTSPGSGLFAVDCSTQRAYVPLNTFDANGNGQVAVIDLTVDPDVTNPVLAIIC